MVVNKLQKCQLIDFNVHINRGSMGLHLLGAALRA